LERRPAAAKAECERVVDLMVAGEDNRTLCERLAAAEARRGELEAAIAAAAVPPVELHPQAGELFRRQVADLKALLAAREPHWRAQAVARLRELVEKVVVRPAGPYAPAEIDIYGRWPG